MHEKKFGELGIWSVAKVVGEMWFCVDELEGRTFPSEEVRCACEWRKGLK